MGSVFLGCDLCSVNSSLNVTQDSKGNSAANERRDPSRKNEGT